jgi:LPXTG-motif cell wall-anchored protein
MLIRWGFPLSYLDKNKKLVVLAGILGVGGVALYLWNKKKSVNSAINYQWDGSKIYGSYSPVKSFFQKFI